MLLSETASVLLSESHSAFMYFLPSKPKRLTNLASVISYMAMELSMHRIYFSSGEKVTLPGKEAFIVILFICFPRSVSQIKISFSTTLAKYFPVRLNSGMLNDEDPDCITRFPVFILNTDKV